MNKENEPRVLVPYGEPAPEEGKLDVFVYLRPETNGVDVESAVFQVVRERSDLISLQYLANIPGEYISSHNIVERHYEVRVCFARQGADLFTESMKHRLEEATGISFALMPVCGAFDALRRLNMTEEELFSLRVPEEQVFEIEGQVVKKIQDLYVVNYDIPALLHRNRNNTDIAVMLFRAAMDYPQLFELVSRMRLELLDRNLINPDLDLSRAVHVSRGPVEQLIDARDYLVSPTGEPLGIMASPFAKFLAARGIDESAIAGLAHFPICTVCRDGKDPEEVNLLEATKGLDYETAWRLLRTVTARVRIPR